jgi:hypothetical protein
MTQTKISATTPYSSTSRENSSSGDWRIRLHFCTNGHKKLDQLRRSLFVHSPEVCLIAPEDILSLKNEDILTLAYAQIAISYAEEGWFSPPSPECEDVVREAATLVEMGIALQRFHQAWGYCTEMILPSIPFVVLWGGTLHLIVECASGTTEIIKGLSADCLEFFKTPSSGTPTKVQMIPGHVMQMTYSEWETSLMLKGERYYDLTDHLTRVATEHRAHLPP